jgi:hypothetical protein
VSVDGLHLGEDRSYEKPRRPTTGCTCKCRADINDNIPENANRQPRFAFGEATAANCMQASREAKRLATRSLGSQPKHVGCECSD